MRERGRGSADQLEAGLRLDHGVWPYRQRDARQYCGNSRDEVQAQGFMQQKRADDRSDDWIKGDRDGEAVR
jgi:hypothetical protein